MTWAYATKRIKLRSRYSLLFFHVSIRVASQACGVAFGIIGWANSNVLLAYLILGAEGYFTLVRTAMSHHGVSAWISHRLSSM